MAQLMYEFDGVVDKETEENKLVLGSRYTNPVNIIWLVVGRGAVLQYADVDSGFTTSKVEHIFIHEDQIHFITRNTKYWLKPYIRERSDKQ